MEITPKVLEECVLPRVSKPNRYIFPWAQPQTEFPAAAGRLCVVSPCSYEAALADPRLLAISGSLIRRAVSPGSAYVDVVFQPWPDLASALRDAGGRLFGLASRRPLATFDVLVALVHNPLDLGVLAFMLELGGVEPSAAARGPGSPAVIVAGDLGLRPGVALGIADRVLAGDPEAFGSDLLNLATRLHEAPDAAARRGALALLDGDGVWGPELVPANPRWLATVPYCGFTGVPPSETDEDALIVEIARPRGMEDPVSPPPPVRALATDQALVQTEHGLAESGMADVVFAGGSAPAHPSLVTLLETHHQRFSTHGVTGRTTAVDPAHFSMSLARELRKGKSSRLVFLPVAASERLRALCGRPLARAAFLNVVETVLRGGWGQVRLAFVLGIPEETEADRDELRGLVEEIRGMRPPGGNPSRIHIELIPFSPLPATPRAAELPADRTLVASVDAAWRRRFAKGNRFAVSTGSPIRAAVTALLWRGSPEWADAVLAVARDTRLGSDSEPEAWDEALSRLGFESASPATWPPGLPQAGEGTTVPEDPLPAWQCKSFGVPPWASPGRRPRREGRTGPGRRADRYRIRFSKSEAARFTSHLDVGRALERGFRRAQLPVAWSQGKEPRPKVAFGPPLPLGMTGDAEYLDVVFSRDVPDTFLGAMSGMLPEGLALTAAAPVRNEAASLASAIQFADYEVWFPDSLLEQDFDGVSFDGLKDRLETRVTEVMASDTFEITRVRKERMQKINARPSLKKMEVVRDDGGRPVLSLRLTLNQPESIRPEPLTAALCHWVAFDERLLRIHRTGLYIPGREGPLDPLEVVRADFAWWRQPIRGGTVL